MSPDSTIQIQNLTKTFGTNKALDNLSLALDGSGPFGIVGPDGAGKTTLMRILAGVMSFKGSVSVLGARYPAKSNIAKQKIGYMPQIFGLYQDLSVKENLIFFAELFGMTHSQINEQMDYLLDFSNLKSFTNLPAGKLSGGMKQKLALCSCLIHEPELLILDEPGAGVDPVSRREFWEILSKLIKQGIMVVVATTYMDEAAKCAQVIYLKEGKISVEGSVDQIKGQYPLYLYEFSAQELRTLRSSLVETGMFKYVNFFGDVLHAAGSVAIDEVEILVSKTLSGKFTDISWQKIPPGLEDVFVHLGGEVDSGVE